MRKGAYMENFMEVLTIIAELARIRTISDNEKIKHSNKEETALVERMKVLTCDWTDTDWSSVGQ
jgi:hypothetical protein